MNKNLGYLVFCGWLFSLNVQAAPGEFWELTSTMEGMGMSMPGQTSKQCLPLKDEGQPAGVDRNCKITDLKRIANGATWKMSCNDGTTGSGKQTRTKDTITSDILMNTSDGSMKMSMKGKRVGGSCDTGDQAKAMMAEAEKSCELADKKAAEVILAGEIYTSKGALCAGKKEQYCSLVKRELPNDIDTYQALAAHRQDQAGAAAIKGCGLNVEAARKSLCKANASNKKEIRFLDAHCPAEAKSLHEKMRAEYCSGRQFTAASDKAKCLSGADGSADAYESSGDSAAATEQGSGKSESAAPDMVKEGTKALKGLKDAFGF